MFGLSARSPNPKPDLSRYGPKFTRPYLTPSAGEGISTDKMLPPKYWRDSNISGLKVDLAFQAMRPHGSYVEIINGHEHKLCAPQQGTHTNQFRA